MTNWGLSVGRKQTLVGAGAHDGPSLIDHNLLLDICFFGASKAPPPTDGFFKPTDKPKFEKMTEQLHVGLAGGARNAGFRIGRLWFR